ncbi:hypothetical protein LJC11_02095 [Bacteroidales bacterium OttesenSCG-928-I21]|nr:hypothetical protein [Bacteroidales bacterium OttesenSCG-928-I21]
MIGCRKYFLLVLVFFYASVSYSQQLYLFTRESQNDDYRLELSKKYEEQKFLHSFLEKYQEKDQHKSYITSGYDSIISDTISSCIKAYYTRGICYSWDKIFVRGVGVNYKAKIEKFLNKKTVNPEDIRLVVKKTLENKADNGYPFASVKFDSLNISNEGRISGNLLIESGNLYRFDSLVVKGDAKIKPYYLHKYLGIKKGDIFSLSTVKDISRKIKNIAFLDESRAFELAFSDSIADVLLYLKKRKANQFTGLIGILPNNKTTGKVLITGDVNLYLLNSLGLGELFSFKWQKHEALSQNLNVEISLPYLFKTNFGLGVLFNMEKKDSSYLNTDFTGKIIMGNNVSNGFDVYYRNKTSFILKKTSENEEISLSNTNVNLVGFSYKFSNLNNVYNPSSGIILYATTAFGTKAYNLDTELETAGRKSIFENRSKIDISGFIPIGRVMAIKLRNQASMIFSKLIFNNELDFIGGLNTIRGFDELSIPVSSYNVASIEYRYLFEEASGVFAFFDAAYFEKRFTNNDNFNYGLGLGVGLDLKTQAGIFSLVFAIGKQNDNPFLFNSSKIHFGYKNYF